MHAGKLTTAAIAASLLLFSNLAHADNKADTEPEAKPVAAKSAKSTKAKATARSKASAKSKAATATPAKATTASKGIAAKDAAQEPPAVTADAEAADLSIINVDEDVAWFDQPIIAPVKKSAAKTPAKKVKKAPRYGVAIGLGSRTTGDEPSVVREQKLTQRFNRNAVVQVVRDNTASVGYCQAKARRAGEKTTEMLLSFKVNKRGEASAITVTDSAGKKVRAMSRCISKRMKSWEFPATGTGGSVEYPLMVRDFSRGAK